MVSLCSCQQHKPTDLTDLKLRLDRVERQLGELKFEQFARSLKETAIDVRNPGAARLDSEVGFFLVRIAKVEPYLDGYRINVDIGNPQSATYGGVTLITTWGRGIRSMGTTNVLDAMEKWSQGLKTNKTELTEDLLPATWNNVSIILSPATPDSLQDVTMRLEVDTIQLRTP
jgi:hypothetical protein